MSTQRLGIIMHGVTGRMGMNQHLIRSIVAIRNQGGVTLSNGDKVMPDPILIGRDAGKVERLAQRFDVERWSTDLDKALAASTGCSTAWRARSCGRRYRRTPRLPPIRPGRTVRSTRDGSRPCWSRCPAPPRTPPRWSGSPRSRARGRPPRAMPSRSRG
mgnify:CR=1 FL=1